MQKSVTQGTVESEIQGEVKERSKVVLGKRKWKLKPARKKVSAIIGTWKRPKPSQIDDGTTMEGDDDVMLPKPPQVDVGGTVALEDEVLLTNTNHKVFVSKAEINDSGAEILNAAKKDIKKWWKEALLRRLSGKTGYGMLE